MRSSHLGVVILAIGTAAVAHADPEPMEVLQRAVAVIEQHAPVAFVHSYPNTGEKILTAFDPNSRAFVSVSPNGEILMRTREGALLTRKDRVGKLVSYERVAGAAWVDPVAKLQGRLTCVVLLGIFDRRDAIRSVVRENGRIVVTAVFPMGSWAFEPAAQQSEQTTETVKYAFSEAGRLLSITKAGGERQFVYAAGDNPLGMIQRFSDHPDSGELVATLGLQDAEQLLNPTTTEDAARRLVDRSNATRIIRPDATSTLMTAAPGSETKATNSTPAGPASDTYVLDSRALVLAGCALVLIGGVYWIRRRMTG